MKNSHRLLAAILAAVLSLLCLNGPIGAEESATVPTDPGGFNPGTGQINPGGQERAPVQSSEFKQYSDAGGIAPGAQDADLEAAIARGRSQHAPPGNANFRRSKHAAGIAKRRRWSARPHDNRQRARFQRVEDGRTWHIGNNRHCHGRTTTLRTNWLRRRNQPREILQTQRHPRSHANHGTAAAAQRSATHTDL